MKLLGVRKWLLALSVCGMAFLQAGAAVREPKLRSASVLVQDQLTGELLLQKKAHEVLPIASLTKLVTAMVILDARLDLNEGLTILEEDKDTLRHSHSRLPVGTRLTREQAMLLALMASENRAAHALGRTYPGGIARFLEAMNGKAQALGLKETRFGDPAGLSNTNVSSALDLARIVDAAHHYAKIRAFSTRQEAEVQGARHPLRFHNTNMLIDSPRWQIGLSKTGFIEESGQCLVMQAQVGKRPVLIVLLDANGRHSRFEDANRIRTWMEGPDVVKPVRVARRIPRRRRR
jgi:D-alanyl-D-alanine endopeptidase (penicillin-binding protein 7)